MVLSRDNIINIISRNDFDSLIGEIENDCFDCKGQPYQLQNDSEKRELAKDVSSFANNEGGYILIGIKTKPSINNFGDEIEEIRAFEKALINPSQYYDTIKSWIYPEIEGTDISWVSIKKDSGKGILIIKIPEQNESLKPFVIKKSIDGKKVSETLLGYVQRKKDNSKPFSVVDLQNALRNGFNFNSFIRERFDALEALLKRNEVSLPEIKFDDKTIGNRVTKSLEYEGMDRKRTLTISAYPSQPDELKTIFISSEGGILKLLEEPPTLRRLGWSLETHDQARIMRGELIRVTNGKKKVIDLYRDGTFILSGLADHTFLAHASPSDVPRINSVAIVEIVYNFVNFYKLVINDFENKPKRIFIGIDLRNMRLGGVNNYLLPYGIRDIEQVFGDDGKDAPDNNWNIVKSFNVDKFDVGIISFELLKEIYLWFGFKEEGIPYVKKEGEIKRVDPNAIIDV
ncbi:MAG: ATP-binding protein [Candidatus Paceibacterota bacterium]|jgi:hypothetical protein